MPRLGAVVAALSMTAAMTVSLASPASAYCLTGTKWNGGNRTPYARAADFSSTWRTALNSATGQWRGQSGSTLTYNNPNYTDSYLIGAFRMSRGDFAALGFPDVPGLTTNSPSSGSYHTGSSVYFNNRFSWNVSGTMNQSQRQVDVWTIAVHELGHSAGLQHPNACGGLTQAEIDSVMHVDWRAKRYTNSDDDAASAYLY